MRGHEVIKRGICRQGPHSVPDIILRMFLCTTLERLPSNVRIIMGVPGALVVSGISGIDSSDAQRQTLRMRIIEH